MFGPSVARALWGCLLVLATGSWAWAEAPIQYNRDVRPILSENCFRCHGPDSASRKADLRLDRREVAVETGAIDPGKPDDSSLVEHIFSTDPDKLMPPASSHKKLSAAQKELLKRWIAAGAEYQPHWSLIAPLRPPLPAVKNESWIKTPIDRFILARLESLALEPAAEADPRTLARRASLDLTGLPPEPADVEQFVSDPAADAYEKYVEQLLASPQWGEHRARYWLDAARYADTHGIHIDNFREMWTYRDWVIAAFNRNLPFDQFTIEQLAGDLLPNRTLDQQVASGFNRCNITTNEGGAIDEEYLVLYNRDRVETTSQVWLGLTAGCAVCHDHKFDPLSQREFYELAAFFNNTTQRAMDGNVKDTPPILFVPLPEERPRWDAVAAEMPTVRQQLEARKQNGRPEFDKWLADASAEKLSAQIPADGLRLYARLAGVAGDTLPVTVEGQAKTLPVPAGIVWDTGHVSEQCLKSQPALALELAEAGDIEREQPYTVALWVKLNKPGQSAALVARMDDQHDFRGWDLGLEGGRLNAHLINKWDQDALKIVANGPLNPGEWHHVTLVYDGSSKAAGMRIFVDGVAQPTTVAIDRLQSTTHTDVPLKIAQRHTTLRLDDGSLEDLRIYGRTLSEAEIGQLAKNSRAAWLASKPAAARSDAETNELLGFWLNAFDEPTRSLTARLAALSQEQATMQGRGTIAHVMQERGEAPQAFVLFRGEYDKRRDQVAPRTPAFLPAFAPEQPPNRLGFAQWLLRPDHPLTARVTVNRFWQEVFGTGLVRTAGDFGVSGELPSHAELLDWMAVDFRESGWDVKRLFRMLVTSAAYRQAATITPEKLEKDGQNRQLSRGPRFRMDAEMVRDYALASSGLLVRKLGGPSVKPYQPEGVWEAVAMIESNTHTYVRDKGESLFRRSLYTFWKRSAPPASLDIFNAPSREVCAVRRERTNTPLQALVTLNDPQFVEAAKVLAQRAIKEGGDQAASRADFLARRLLARPLRAEEAPLVEASLNELMGFYQTHADDAKQLLSVGEVPADAAIEPATLAAWTMLTNELMNLDEVLNK